MKYLFEKADYKVKGLNLRLKSEVPVTRGLGSSSACIVGGLVFALCMLLGMPAMFTHLACGAAVFLTRIIAVKYHICLPTLKPEED